MTLAILGGLAWIPAGACSGPDRDFAPDDGNGKGGAVAQGGATLAGGKVSSGGKVTSEGGAVNEGGAAGSGAAPSGGTAGVGQAGGGAGGVGEAGAGGAAGGAEGGAGGTTSPGTGGTGVGGGAGGACTSGSKTCNGDVPQVCSATGVWENQTTCSKAVLNATSPVCGRGACDYSSCSPSYQDCDANRANGCESAMASDPLNCGGCGKICAKLAQNTTASACAAGVCDYTACAGTYQDCDAIRTNGCESNKSTDSLNCGGCGRDCAKLVGNATSPVCNGAGACDYAACSGTYQDCDTNRANGCESNKSTDLVNCGSCGRNCTTLIKGATAVCSAGSCDYTGCASGYLDCNGVRGDGCERPPTAGTAGYPTAFTTSSSFSPNYLLGHQITVPCSILTGWGINSKSAGSHMMMGLYRDVSGAPGALVATSPVFTTANATQTLAATSQVVLSAGTYWLMGVHDGSGATMGQDTSGTNSGQIDYISFTYGTALPTTFPAPTTYTAGRINYYLILQ